MKLHRYYFDFVDSHGEDNSVYVFAYNEKDAKKYFDTHILEEYDTPITEFEMDDEGEIDFPAEDVCVCARACVCVRARARACLRV